MKKNKKIKRSKEINRIISILLLSVMLLTLPSGCISVTEGSNDADRGSTGEAAETGVEGAVGNTPDTEWQGVESVAMGRFVEEVTDLSDRISGYRNNLFQLADGSLIITDGVMPFLISKDNGVTWEEDTSAWHARMIEKEEYLSSVAIGADYTVAAIKGELGETGEYMQRLFIVKPDGTEIPVEVPLTADEKYPHRVGMADDGRILVSVLGSDNLYEVKEDGSCELFLTLEKGDPELMQFQGSLCIMDGYGYKTPLLYDMEKGEYIEDEVLGDFISEHYRNGNNFSSSTDDGFDMYFFPGEEDILYLAGEKGLHRHVIGGSAMEQVIDGSLCSLSNPAYRIEAMVMLENNEFLAIFSGARLVRFVYNPDIPTVPNEKLKVYSLKDNSTIRQAISLYQTANPAVFVEYEIGIEEGSSMTREDALKMLNTKIMAGEGPDVLVLDNMPLDSYREKGFLLDLNLLLGSLSGEEEVFGNIVAAMKTGESLYAMPCEIQLPAILGEGKYMTRAKDLEGIADMIEELRQDNPEKDIIKICTEKGIMRLFSMVCVPAWTMADGGVDREAITEFLKETKRIYDAQMDGLPEKMIDRYIRSNEFWMELYGETKEDSKYFRTGARAIEYIGDNSQLVFGALDGRDAYAGMVSVNRVDGFEDCIWSVMNGQSSNVFCAETLLGINAASPYITQAEAFLKMCLGKENQTNLFNGFAVNKAAFEENFVIDTRWVEEDGAYYWEGTLDEDGVRTNYVVYWPDEKQIAELRKCIEAADTPYIEDAILENAVFEEGIDYMQGKQNLEEAVDAIVKKVALYMAE